MCHLLGEQRCSPFFYPCRKAGELRRIRLPRVFLRARERPPFVDKSCVLPSPPPRQKTFFRACPVSGDRPVTSGKTSGCLQKRSVSSIWLRRIPDGLRRTARRYRGRLPDACPWTIPQIIRHFVSRRDAHQADPQNKKGRGKSPAALVSGDGLRPSQAHSRP